MDKAKQEQAKIGRDRSPMTCKKCGGQMNGVWHKVKHTTRWYYMTCVNFPDCRQKQYSENVLY